ncbi:MAG: branched-chain amino acid transport system ATP-binding protein [Acidimicrobiaceae bacterium]|nr:branched-chain amino acid transport system ATP-binding protein [Acidimicrobiaceae bacterium]
MTSLLEVEGIDVFYGSVQALRGISMRVDAGEMVALLGANGAGKTTTLRTISGLLAPRTGSIRFDGNDIAGVPAHKLVRLGIAHLPEGRDLFPSLTVEENLRYGFWSRRRTAGAEYKDRLEGMFDYFPRLKERRSQAAGTLSGGEQQMLGVARALMSKPRLLIVDELSLGLAPIIVEQLFGILREVNATGTAILLVEQFVHMVLANTNRAYVLGKGEVRMEKPSAALLDDPELVSSYLGEEGAAAAGYVVEPKTPPAESNGSSSDGFNGSNGIGSNGIGSNGRGVMNGSPMNGSMNGSAEHPARTSRPRRPRSTSA